MSEEPTNDILKSLLREKSKELTKNEKKLKKVEEKFVELIKK